MTFQGGHHQAPFSWAGQAQITSTLGFTTIEVPLSGGQSARLAGLPPRDAAGFISASNEVACCFDQFGSGLKTNWHERAVVIHGFRKEALTIKRDLFWLMNEQFRRIEPHLPTDTWGKAPVDDRRVISGMVQFLKSGGRWIDALTDFGRARRRTIGTRADPARASGWLLSTRLPAQAAYPSKS